MQGKVVEALEQLRFRQSTGLAGESSEQVKARLASVETLESGQLFCTFFSDGLGLDAKLAIEQGLKELLLNDSIKINFKRQHRGQVGQEVALSGAAPAALLSKKAIFGLDIDRRAIPGVTQIIAVASGKGGVGKSTVSVNLAVALAAMQHQGRPIKVGLLDADIYGPSVPMMLGLSGRVPVVHGERLVPLEAYGVKTASFGFLTDTEQPVIWRGPLVAKAFKQLCYDVAWGQLDYLVIDLPPGTGDIQLAMIESLPIHQALIVTTPQDIALLDAHKALTMFQKLDVPVLGLVENMAYYHCPACGHQDAIFGEGGAERMGASRGLKVLARIPLQLAVRLGGDEGHPAALLEDSGNGAPFERLARALIGTD